MDNRKLKKNILKINIVKLLFIFQILFIYSCLPRWIPETPPPTDKYQFIVGVSEFRNSEKKSRNEALHHAYLQFAQICGVNIEVMSKYFEEYGKKNNLDYDNQTYMTSTKNFVNVHIHSIKPTKWYIVKNTEHSDIKWKAYVLTSIPIELEEDIRNYKKEMEKKCSDFLLNSAYLKARGKSFESADLAHEDAINVYKNILKQETTRKYGVYFDIINNEEMSCSDGNKLYYILGVKSKQLESEAKQKILAIVSKTNHRDGIQILKRNEQLFTKNDDLNIKRRYEKLLRQITSVNEFINKLENNYRKILYFENVNDYYNSYLITGQIDFLPDTLKKFLTEHDNVLIENVNYHKAKNEEVMIIIKSLQSLKKDLYDLKRTQDLGQNAFHKKFSDILEKYTDSKNENKLKYVEKDNPILIEYLKKFNEILNIFENNIKNFFFKTNNNIPNFEPIKNQNEIDQILTDISFYKNNIYALRNNEVKESLLFRLLELEVKIKKIKTLQIKLLKEGFKYVSSGDLLMGNRSTESPLHMVRISSPYYVCEHEVTVDEYQNYFNLSNLRINNIRCHQRNRINNYRICDNSEPSALHSSINDCSLSNWTIVNEKMTVKEGRTNHPMNCVSWEDATSYINWINNEHMLGSNYYYHLCTEAQWEYAARGNKCTQIIEWTSNNLAYKCANFVNQRNKDFVCGNTGDQCLKKSACYDRLCEGTCEIKSKEKNAWGLYDMNGNIAEWVQDKWYSFLSNDLKIYTNLKTIKIGQIVVDPVGDKKISNDSGRIYKGGSYWSRTGNMKVSTRDSDNTNYRSTSIGFRICVSKKTKKMEEFDEDF